MPHGNAPVKMPTLCTFCLLSRLFRAGVYKSVFIEMNYIPILCANLEKGLCIQEGFDAELIDFYTLLSPCVAGEHSRNKFPVIVRHLKKVLSNPLTSLIVTPRQLVDYRVSNLGWVALFPTCQCLSRSTLL